MVKIHWNVGWLINHGKRGLRRRTKFLLSCLTFIRSELIILHATISRFTTSSWCVYLMSVFFLTRNNQKCQFKALNKFISKAIRNDHEINELQTRMKWKRFNWVNWWIYTHYNTYQWPQTIHRSDCYFTLPRNNSGITFAFHFHDTIIKQTFKLDEHRNPLFSIYGLLHGLEEK